MRRRLPVLITLCCAVALPSAAHAARMQESMFQDDNRLVYATPGDAAHTLDTLKALGVDRVRISVFWHLVAPDSKSATKPDFQAADPAAYPQPLWDRYDTLVKLARDRGIAVNFNVTSPAPNWATGTPKRTDIDAVYDPDPVEFNRFVRALGERYTGTYVPAEGQPPLPRVNYWSIWNEPNQGAWLAPQWGIDPRNTRKFVETSPRIYRSLVDAAYDALQVTGHGQDTLLVGETAPKGVKKRGETRQMSPLRFIRQLYCLDSNLQFEQGTSAQLRGCPVSDPRGKFIAQHPALFKMTGYAHHPYELLFAPDQRSASAGADDVTTANLPTMTRLFTKIYQRYGQPLPGGAKQGMPLYLTEFGYQTNPPDPSQPTSPAKQAVYLNQAEYIAWRNPTVKTLSQFLLYDDKPVAGVPRNSVNAWLTFQSGIVNINGSHKPAYAAYELPVWVPKHRGRKLTVWGGVRMAAPGPRQTVTIELRPKGRKKFHKIASAQTDGLRGYFTKKVTVSGPGALRTRWRGHASRSVRVTIPG
jgi:hypothetical protein